MSKKTFASFEEFWPSYVRAHSNKTNRRLHFVGTSLAVACLGGAVILRRKSLLLLAPVVGYGMAWIGHFGFEKNVPATFGNPLWSLQADMKMWMKIVDGTMDAEVERVLASDEVITTAASSPEKEEANGAHVDTTAN